MTKPLYASLTLALALIACSSSPAGTNVCGRCLRDSDCQTSLACASGFCVSAGEDPALCAATGSGSTITSGATTTATSGSSGATSTSSGGPCGAGSETLAGLVVAVPLKLSVPIVQVGQSLTGTVTLCNPTGRSVSLKAVAIAGRPPGGTNAGGPFLDLYEGPGLTVAAGQSVVISGGRQFTSADPLGVWYAYATIEDGAGVFHDSANDVTFSVASSSSSSSSGAASTSSLASSSSSAGSTTVST